MSDTQAQTGFKFSRKRIVTKPLFKWANNKECYYRFDTAYFIGKELVGDENKGRDGKKKEPATLAFVTDLETGEEGQIILGKVLQGILTDEYPDNAYVGRCFAIEQHKVTGKDYNGYSVVEIEPDEAEVSAKPEKHVKAVK